MRREWGRLVSLVGSPLALSIAAGPAAARVQPEQVWYRQVGSNGNDGAGALAPDKSGGTYVAGSFGAADVSLARYSAEGDQSWFVEFGSGKGDDAAALAMDGKGGVFIAGTTYGDLGGPNQGGGDIFLARYDDSGQQLWLIQFGGDGADFGLALAPDGKGGAYVAGSIFGGSLNAFVARYDGAGNRAWLKQFGTMNADWARAAASDGQGGLFVTGDTEGDLAGVVGGIDAFLARYDSAGGQVWVRQFGSTTVDRARAAAADGSGGVFAAGETKGDFGAPNLGLGDVFLARFDGAGSRLWVDQYGTTGDDIAFALAPGIEGAVYVAGYTEGSLGGQYFGTRDVFIARHQGDGERDWTAQFGTATDDIAFAMASDSSGGAFVAGQTDWAVDAFVARYMVPCYPDCNESGDLDLFDFLCFVNQFNLGGWVYADCTGDELLDLFDFLCFVNAFNAGC